MKPSAFIGALIGAGLGALLWAGVAYATGLEIGWIAWGVGGMIGVGAALGGGRGGATGLVCAGLAVAAILAGKWLTVDMVAERELREIAEKTATTNAYADVRIAAHAFADVEYEDEYADFMVEYGYTEAQYEEDVTSLEVEAFRGEIVPVLRKFARERPTYEEWKKSVGDEVVKEWRAVGSNSEVVGDSLGAMDILFFVLGVLTAFSVGSKGMANRMSIQYRPRPQRTGDGEYGHPDAYPPSTAPPVRSDEPQPSAYPPSTAPPLRQPEPPNPYAYPTPEPEPPPEPTRPTGPVSPRKIPRLRQPAGSPSPRRPGPDDPYEPSRKPPSDERR